MKKKLLFLLAAFSILSEILLKINPVAGFASYFVLITSSLLLLSRKELTQEAKLVIIFLIIPILRISQLFLNLNFFWKTLVFYYLFLFLVVFYSINLKIERKKGKTKVIFIFLAILIGIMLLIIAKKIVQLNEPLLLIILPVIAFCEEFFFREMLQNTITKNYSFALGIIISSLLYMTFATYFGIAFLFFSLLCSIISGIFYEFTKSLKYCIIINFLMHLGMIL